MSELDVAIPEEVRCTDDLDCVLLTDPPSYYSSIVKVAAVEMGLKWKPFIVDIGTTG